MARMEPAPARKSFLDHAGAVAATLVKHVPTRGVLWGAIGLVVGIAGVLLSYAIGPLILGRGSMVLGYLVVIPLAIPPLGAAFFFVHGLQRGAARAALALEQKAGLVSYLVTRARDLLIQSVGGPVSNLPLQQLETKLKDALGRLLSTSEGSGIVAWVVNRAKRSLSDKIETYLLAAYRAEQQTDGKGGGVSLEKIFARVTEQLSEKLGDLLMSPLNKQLALFMTLYVLLAGGWWIWLTLLARALTVGSGAAAGG